MYLALLPGPLQNPLLNGSLHHQPVDGDLFGLAEAVGPVHGLLVHCGVPVTVIEYHLHTCKRDKTQDTFTWVYKILPISLHMYTV